MASPQRALIAEERDAFIGRGSELAELARLLAEGKRLVTLLGTGGSGKTRLALHFARTSGRAAHFCDLSQCKTRLDCIEVVARTFALPLPLHADPESLGAVVGYALAESAHLLVLDNFETVVEPGRALVEEWLDLAPGLSLIVTSRERLRVRGEHCLELGPLALPEPGADAERVLDSEAVQLFLVRARALGSEPVAPDSAHVLAQLVAKLEGLPLAIELCAARATALGPAQLLERLERRFETLADRGVRAPRQATLEATIDWSWRLLEPLERQALAQSAIFRGDFDLIAAEHVIETSPREPVLDLLESLIDKSLLLVRDGASGDRRYALFESIREFSERALEPEQRRGAEQRHTAYYLERARSGPSDVRRLALEEANLLAVFERALDSDAVDTALAAALALEPVFATRGPLQSLIGLLDRVIAAGADPPPRELARARLARGLAKVTAGAYASAIDDLECARANLDSEQAVLASARLAIAHTWLGRPALAQAALSEARQMLGAERPYLAGHVEAAFGILRSTQARVDEALEHYRRALAWFRKSGARRDEATALENLGNRYLERGELGEAEDHLNAALGVFRELGELRLEAHTLGDLGVLHIEQGRFEDAEAALGRALELSERVGDRHWPGILNGFYGDLELERGRTERAYERYRWADERLSEIGDKRYAALFRLGLSGTEALLGRISRAEQLLESARADLRAAGTSDDRVAAELWQAIVDLARGARAAAEQRRARAALEYAAERHAPNEVRFPARLLAALLGESRSTRRLALAHDASWFEFAGARVTLVRRASLRRILLALVYARESGSEPERSVVELFEAGWPGQRVHPDSASHRVHVAIASLRKLGLGDALVTRGEGYALAAELAIDRQPG